MLTNVPILGTIQTIRDRRISCGRFTLYEFCSRLSRATFIAGAAHVKKNGIRFPRCKIVCIATIVVGIYQKSTTFVVSYTTIAGKLYRFDLHETARVLDLA